MATVSHRKDTVQIQLYYGTHVIALGIQKETE